MKTLLGVFALLLLLTAALFAQTTLYLEDFANGTLQNPWIAGYNGNNMEVEFLSGNPSGDSWVGKLGNDISGGNVGQSYSGDPTWTDFYTEAWVYIPIDEGTYYGIEFRVGADTNSYGYQFSAIFNPNNTIGLSPQIRFRVRPSGGFPTNIKSWTAGEIPGGIPSTSGWHKLAVNAVGNQFWFYYDNQELPGNPYTDNTYSSGRVGAYIWDFVLSPIYLYIDDFRVTDTPVGIEDERPGVIADYVLHQNYPNPFNPSTTISFDLATRETVQLNIFNNLGQKVRTLANSDFSPGTYQVQWDGRDESGQVAPAGVYYYRLQAAGFYDAKKMLLIK